MNGLEQAILEKFDRDGKVAVWLGHDDLSSILSYLFIHSASIYFNGRYTIFKRDWYPLFFIVFLNKLITKNKNRITAK